MKAGGEDKIHSKVSNCFHSKVSKLNNFTNRQNKIALQSKIAQAPSQESQN